MTMMPRRENPPPARKSLWAFALACALAALLGYVSYAIEAGNRAFTRGDYAGAWKAFENPAAAAFPDALYVKGVMLRQGLGRAADPEAALALFTEAAGMGHLPSMLAAGELSRKRPDGRGQALRFFEQAALRDDERGMTALALLLTGPDSPSPDPARALALLETAARRGFVPAEAALGLILRDQAALTRDKDPAGRAFHWLSLAADGNDVKASRALGLMLREGLGGPPDPAGAAAFFLRAARQGDAFSQETLGDMYASGEGVERFDLEAAKWYALAAGEGRDEAKFKLADMYLHGRGVFRDKEEALRLYRLSGEKDPKAQDRLCALFATGPTELRDQAEAVLWCRKAAEAGVRDSQRALGLMLLRGLGTDPAPEEAARWLARADQAGDAMAGYALGLMYLGGMGLARDYGLALDHMRRAAESGLPEAQYFLASMYDEELRSTSNYARALSWYRKAAEAGDARARFNLGSMYGKGLGVERDYAEAYRWFKAAAEQGDPRAQYNAGLMRLTGKGAPEDAAEAFRWMLMAARQGDAKAQFNAGSMFLSGRGTAVNAREAVRWYRLSALQGFGPAQSMLSALYYEGRRLPRSFSEAYYWIVLAAGCAEDFSGRDRAAQARELLGRRLSKEQRSRMEERAAAFSPRKISPADEEHLLPPLRVLEEPETAARPDQPERPDRPVRAGLSQTALAPPLVQPLAPAGGTSEPAGPPAGVF